MLAPFLLKERIILMRKFECVEKKINNLSIPMLSIDGELYITQHNLANLLGVDEITLRRRYQRKREDFESNRVQSLNANEFIKQNKTKFGLKYVRNDMRLWTEDDMLTFGQIVRGEKGRRIRKEMRIVIKQHSKHYVISPETYEKLSADLALAKYERDEFRKRAECAEAKTQALSVEIDEVRQECKRLSDRMGDLMPFSKKLPSSLENLCKLRRKQNV